MPFKMLSTSKVEYFCGYFGFLVKNYSVIRMPDGEIN